MRNKIAPLSGGFMIVGMFGFLFALIFLRNYSLNWAFIVGSVSTIIFVASLISTTYAPVEEELTLDEPLSERKRRVKIYSLKEYEEHLKQLKQRQKKEIEELKKQKPKTRSKKSSTKKTKTTKKKQTAKKSTKKSSTKKSTKKKQTTTKKTRKNIRK